ncbi:MAG: phosphoribosylformylglycinamidine synthase subunit PurS [Asgard group archaeon]|nr:phosphoribosylformylglycinamidine synthase subunit PurS [Asgard group archaeon]
MPIFSVEIVIEGKKSARDPEGETIMRDLMIKNGYAMVTSVRTGKVIKVKLEAENEAKAEEICLRMVNELRIYNPVAHTCTIKIVE